MAENFSRLPESEFRRRRRFVIVATTASFLAIALLWILLRFPARPAPEATETPPTLPAADRLPPSPPEDLAPPVLLPVPEVPPSPEESPEEPPAAFPAL